MDPPPDFANLSLAEIARLAEDGTLPPVDRWNPAHCGDSGMRILADGSWLHDGTPIARTEMVRLFSTILRREPDGGYVLVTPVEKLSIAVDDAPFVAVEAKVEGEGETARIAFRLRTGEMVVAGPANPVHVTGTVDQPRPYVQVRGGMAALIVRSVFYELADMAVAGPGGATGIWSQGAFFPLNPA